MATDVVTQIDKQSKNITELLAFIKQELDADAERHASLQASATAAGEALQEPQTGATLDLSKKKLSALPVEAIGLMKDKVERLAVSHNPQISLPSQIVQCERLRYLNIRWNQLTHFPDVVLQLSKLEILDLSGNKLTEIPEDIKKLSSLKFLAVAKNRITKLPFALGEMSSLGKLKFEENPIEFPPADAIKLSPERMITAHDTEREKEICQKVKRFLRAAAVKEKLRMVSEEDMSEDHVETPRPPKRTVITGRFPIRPSMSGLDSMIESKTEPSADVPIPPPIPQKSHARVESNNAPIAKRPGIAALLTAGNDVSRSRSDTVSSSISLRQRRQGYVPIRKPTGDLESVNENGTRSSQASTIKPSHTRGTSSVSTTHSAVAPSSGDTSGAVSPVDGRSDPFREGRTLPNGRRFKTPNTAIGVSRRICFTLPLLGTAIASVAVSMRDGAPHASSLGRQLFTVQTHVKELGRLLNQLESGPESRIKPQREVTVAAVRAVGHTLKSYVALMVELKQRSDKVVRDVSGVQVRAVMFQTQSSMVELRNICCALGFAVKERTGPQDDSRVSRAWSSKSVTPTQPKAPSNRRMARPAMLKGLRNNTMPQAIGPPPMAMKPEFTRSNTMTSQTSNGTTRSIEPYATAATGYPTLSRADTMRSFLEDNEGDEQFDKIFLKLETACNLAGQALPQCRRDFQTRKEQARNDEQYGLSQQWNLMINKCEEVLANNRALKKRLEAVKVNDPGLRHQRDFWQLCDAFVHSWTEFATEVKDLSARRIDISSIKPLMRSVQKHVKDVSKTISNSPLYNHALGSSKVPSVPFPPSLASPFPSGWNDTSKLPSSYVTTPVPATPLSAALGPAVHATVATPTMTAIPREYFPEPLTARPVRERNDTPMQQSVFPRRF